MLDRSISRRYRWKVQGRLAVLDYAAIYGIRPAAARFGLDRKTVRAWRARFREVGTVGLVPRYPKRRRRSRTTDKSPGALPPDREGEGRGPPAPCQKSAPT
jgi:transposase